jgi:hypothetical protein
MTNKTKTITALRQDYPAAILANFDGDYRAAYEHLSKAYLALNNQFTEVWSSRFIEISRFEPDSEICVRQITEESISQAVDMADCLPEFTMRKWLYVDDAGDLLPVTIGRQERINTGEEAPFRFAASAIVAGGKCVGEVVFTDH